MTEIGFRSISLVPVKSEHLELLVAWRNSADYRASCTTDTGDVTSEMIARMVHRRPFQFMIAHNSKGIVGTIYANRYSREDGHLFVTTYLSPGNRGFGYGPIALILATLYAFQWNTRLRKVCYEVYSDNHDSKKCFEGGLHRLGFEHEAVLRHHRFNNGTYRTVSIFSFFSESSDRLREFLKISVDRSAGGEYNNRTPLVS